MRKGLFNAAIALGLTTICISYMLEPLVEPRHAAVYHWGGTVSSLFGPTAFIGFTIFNVMLLLVLSAQRPGRWRAAVWSGLILLLPWVVWRTMTVTWPDRMPAWLKFPHAVWGVCLWVLLVLLWRPSISERYEHVIGVVSTVVAFVALSGVLFLVQFGSNWWKARGLNRPVDRRVEALANAEQTPKHRVVWLVLDELSYQQVYERRYPGLKLPNFDALAATSTVFTQTLPVGIKTDRVLPSLMTGVRVDDIRSSPDARLIIHDAAKKRWEKFDQHDTVFQDARNLGYQTGIAGWWNPYCRMMPAVVDRCFWVFREHTQAGLRSPGETWRSNTVQSAYWFTGKDPLARFFWRLLGVGPRKESIHIQDYRDIFAAADKLLRDGSVTFVLLHLPVPHPPGMFDRRTGQMKVGGTYLDNLVVADQYVGHLKQMLEQKGEWDSSEVVVMGDHSWRTTTLWEKDAEWTAEEQRASLGGKFDSRPGYIVKLAGQQTGARIDERFDAIRTRALLDELLAGRIHSPQDLKNWVDHGREENDNYASDVHP